MGFVDRQFLPLACILRLVEKVEVVNYIAQEVEAWIVGDSGSGALEFVVYIEYLLMFLLVIVFVD